MIITSVPGLNKYYQVVNETAYDCRTSADLIRLLEKVRQERTRIVLRYGDTDTGRMWEPDCTPMRGTISRSMGPIKIPLLVRTTRSYGGEGILDHCILQVKESRGGKLLYRHPAHTQFLDRLIEGT